MERGLYIAASGMVAEMARQDLIANDLANSSTPGYKADRAVQGSFGNMLLQNTQTGQTVGPLGNGARIERQVTDLAAQPLKETGEDLDFAIAGDGFFAVQTPQGVRYTRNGQFTAAANGRLVDQRNNPVLGQNGQPLTVGADGKVPQATSASSPSPTPARGRQPLHRHSRRPRHGRGALRRARGLGRGAARAMTDMIASLRAFESGQKVITTIDSTLRRRPTRSARS